MRIAGQPNNGVARPFSIVAKGALITEIWNVRECRE